LLPRSLKGEEKPEMSGPTAPKKLRIENLGLV
jgi:hypothetical protein